MFVFFSHGKKLSGIEALIDTIINQAMVSLMFHQEFD